MNGTTTTPTGLSRVVGAHTRLERLNACTTSSEVAALLRAAGVRNAECGRPRACALAVYLNDDDTHAHIDTHEMTVSFELGPKVWVSMSSAITDVLLAFIAEFDDEKWPEFCRPREV